MLHEDFTYDSFNRLTSVETNGVTYSMVYDSYGRMTGKEKDGSLVFESAVFGNGKPHATTRVDAAANIFPGNQTVEYTATDKVKKISQGAKTASFTYGYDAQRMRMTVTDTLTNNTLTKDYVGSCEFVDDNGGKKVLTYLSSPYGVFAVVVKQGGTDTISYVYKDHLGSWTTVTDSLGNVVERNSYDAWGNLRDAATWSGTPNSLPRFDRGFTGHEHLFDFGLINMSGRVYDPVLSSFLSPDNYMQDPTTQQGFNRYAYCMYNPLKYVDPSGYRYYGYDEAAYFRMVEEMAQRVFQEWYSVYDMAVANVQLTINMACCLFGHGLDTHANGSGHHGAAGGGQEGPNNKRPLIIIRTVTTDNTSPLNNDQERMKYFFIDVGEALEFMNENSFDENMNPYKEISAWVVDGGIIVQPWYDNTETESINTCTLIDDNYYYEFQGELYLIEAQIHTHPNYNNGDIGVSSFDLDMTKIRPVYIIYNSSLYKAGEPAIRLNQIRNINYYNWKNYIIY